MLDYVLAFLLIINFLADVTKIYTELELGDRVHKMEKKLYYMEKTDEHIINDVVKIKKELGD